ncbi:3-oxo-5-alpha-steroid 4-dehydrogenase-domain-containing protein [Radiomyces spectabilis]|uniref:3-oxo-5-alpha-steroid 4-dehydrogenase-domain-containing protein n=1 Tax=Radiomyces spectabilis TaxID=64574 RepID=UPI002220665C|nr:3-oxo-5-alpha-steroid 4-dehydrogenase-domain-containing protein [Radiomyces spectabilis]KAI8377650.1 3-oxo-5-alpha-steroid 4-dehydrogenase-domain-containing protein [Radiomyces spectabilis]
MVGLGYLNAIGFYVPAWTPLTVASAVYGLTLATTAVFTETFAPTPYSKFGSHGQALGKIPSRKAMWIIYLPSMIVCLLFKRIGFTTRLDLIHLLVSGHFLKRLYEINFVHIYSSSTDLMTALTITTCYASTTLLDFLVVRSIPAAVFSGLWLKLGLVLVIGGEVANAYHHWLLRKLRVNRKNGQNYRLPRGGLFNYAVAPHYWTEQIAYTGFVMLSQNVVSLCLKMFPMVYLTLRAARTREWYATRLSPEEQVELKHRKRLIPFVW